MESTDGSALHGYGLRSHGPIATEPILPDAMVGSGLTEAISSAEHSTLGARTFTAAVSGTEQPTHTFNVPSARIKATGSCADPA